MSQLFPNGQPVIREELIQQISEEQLFWDVLVIGGGATQGDFWLVRQASIERGIYMAMHRTW